MKLGRSKARWIAVGLFALAFLFVLAGTASAYEGTPSVRVGDEDVQNPMELWWFNTLTPGAAFSSQNATYLPATTGYVYELDRSFSTVPTLGSDWCSAEGPFTSKVLDIAGTAVDHPATVGGGISRVEEGLWYIHVRSYIATTPGLSDRTADGWFGIDLTPPTPVVGLDAGTRLWTETMRRRITWTDLTYQRKGPGWEWGGGYDALSGDDRWKLTVNDKEFIWDRYLFSPVGVATVEDGLHPGVNVVKVQAVDTAGNESAPASAYVLVDPDYPSLSLDAPAQGEWIHGTYDFKVTASDQAGLREIVFKIDDTIKQTSSTKQSFRLNTATLAAGHHTVGVSVKDMFGHVRTVTHDFYVDNSAIRITSISDAPDPFYPLIADRYKDTMTVKFYLGERANDLYLKVFDESGTSLVRQYHWTNIRAGWVTCGWDGKDDGGSPVGPLMIPGSTTYKYQISAKDRAGNWTNSSFGTTTIRNFELVPVNGGVKVVPR